MKFKMLICIVLIILIGCRTHYNSYKDPKKAKHWYTGKKHHDRWMDIKRKDIELY